MFQTFEVTSRPEDGRDRLQALRVEMARKGLDGFLVPRADAHQGEYVANCDARLKWLTGFTGSAGFCAALVDVAGVFVDGRYRTQVKDQVDLTSFTPVDWPKTGLVEWLIEHLQEGGKIGFDPWLHTSSEIDKLRARGIDMIACENLVDLIWLDRAARPAGKVVAQPLEFAGQTSIEKRVRVAGLIRDAGAVVLTLPDSISWLLNIRGADIARNPVVQAFAILHISGQVDLFTNPEKFADVVLDTNVTVQDWGAFEAAMSQLGGPVQVDKSTAPLAVADILESAGIEIINAPDPCLLPKARKNAAEIQGARNAHLRDGVAMVSFLAWLDQTQPKSGLNEIEVVQKLECFRSASNALKEISFETICGAGPNGAIIHYRVSEKTNRAVKSGELLLIDSGGQYIDGTTDITRTVAIGDVGDEEKSCFTRVLQGMIAISQARFPNGLTGRDLDPLARAPLWRAGLDYDHGTGHGVGSYLSVHEGPQRISRLSEVKLQPGMILSNEPGYYREGAFGIRIENLIVVQKTAPIAGGDDRDMLDFETLTYVPIDKTLIKTDMLAPHEVDWINTYHTKTLEMLGELVDLPTKSWLIAACAPL